MTLLVLISSPLIHCLLTDFKKVCVCGIFRSAVLKLEGASESLGEFVKLQIAVGLTLEPILRVSESVSMGWGPIIYIFNTLPDKADDAVGLRTRLGEPLV